MMKNYIERIYDDILEKRAGVDVLIEGDRGIRIFVLCVMKILNQFRLQVLFFFKGSPMIQGKDIAIILTANQLRSIVPLISSSFVIVRPYLDSCKTKDAKVLFFCPYKYLSDLIAQLKYFYLKEDTSWRNYYMPVAYFYYYKSFMRLFENNKPKSVTITNPSHPISRAAIIAAADLGIPTVYLPHASPSPLYPKITTDYALIEGVDAMNIYKFSRNTKTLLVGSPRLDPYREMTRIPHEGTNILVAANLLDNIEKVYDLCKRLQNHPDTFKCKILFRPHPNLPVNRYKFDNIGVIVISPKEETCLQTLQKTDVLISANSTIFFEAIYFPIRCYYFDFVKEGLIKDSYNLFSFTFIHHLNFDSKININPCNIDKNEADRIDVSINTHHRSKDIIRNIYLNV